MVSLSFEPYPRLSLPPSLVTEFSSKKKGEGNVKYNLSERKKCGQWWNMLHLQLNIQEIIMYQCSFNPQRWEFAWDRGGVGKAKKETGAGGERWRGKKRREGQCIRAGEGGERESVHCNADTFWRQQKCPASSHACANSVSGSSCHRFTLLSLLKQHKWMLLGLIIGSTLCSEAETMS